MRDPIPHLAPADAALAARETALPGLPLVLDAATLHRALEAAGVPVQRVETTYLRFKPGTSAVAGVRIETPSRSIRAQAVAYPVGVHRKLERMLAHAGDGLLLLDAERGIAVVDAAADRALPGIRVALERHPDAEVLVYKPGRRWVARCAACRVIVKVHAPDRAASAIRAQHRVETFVPTAALVRADAAVGLVETHLLAGTPLPQIADPEAERRVGGMLARLHTASAGEGGAADGARPPGIERALARALDAAASGVASVLPALEDRALRAAGAIRSLLEERRVRTLVHGDCSIDQVIVGRDGRPWLIDLDRAGEGDPLSDLGSWAADAIARGESACRAGAALVAGYREAGGAVDEAALLAHTAAGLLRRAAEPFRARAADWDAEVAHLVAESERLVGLAALRADAALPGAAAVEPFASARVIAHRPGRRAVLRRADGDFVKLVRPARFAEVAERAERVSGLRTLRSPRVVARDDAGGVLRLASVGERTLLDAWGDPSVSDDALVAVWTRVGAGLAELHALDPAGLPRHGVADEMRAIRRALASVGGALDGEDVADALAAVEAALAADPPERVDGVLHRDLHDKQLLVPSGSFTAQDVAAGRTRVGLIDVDTLAVGERALDVANLLVHLELRVLQGLLPTTRADAAGQAFRRGLGDGPLWARVPAYSAAARLRLAGVYAQRDGWHDVARALLRRVGSPVTTGR
ncbi:phosphotransferase [Microbacterium sp. KNMS]